LSVTSQLLKKVRLANKRELPTLRLYFPEALPDFFAALRFHPNGEHPR
jgi:hypothetical protein